MLNIKPLAPDGEEYYLETVASGVEDYYLGAGEAPGYWIGGSTAAFGLDGEVDAAALRAVLAATDPRTGDPLTGHGRGRKRSVPGYDATFNAPKSVSLLWALGDPVTARKARDAHDRAVAEAVGYLERTAAVRRRGHKIGVDGLVAAAFRQRTSRAGDPHLHTHVLIANHGRTADDGRWRALDGAMLLSHTRTAGFVYQAVLRHELTRHLGVAFRPVVNGHADVAGMPRWLIEAFSTRRAEILALLDHLGLDSARAAQKAAYATRRAKPHPDPAAPAPDADPRDAVADPRALLEQWRDLAARAGWTDAHLRALLHAAEHQPVTLTQAETVAADLAGATGLTAHASTFCRRDVIRGWAQRLPQGAASSRQLEALADALLADDAGPALRLTRDPLADADRTQVDVVVDALAAHLDLDNAAAVRCSAALAEAVAASLTAGSEPDALVAALTARELHSADDPASVLVYRARRAAPSPPGQQSQGAGQPTIRLATGARVPANPAEPRYSTPELLAIEQALVDGAVHRRHARVGLVPAEVVDAAIADHAAAGHPLSDEQRHLVRQVTSSGSGVEVVVGKAGTGKTTTLGVARTAWEASGHRVVGTALAARAAEQLTSGAGIPSWTVARLLRLADDQGPVLSPRTVLVVDEAAMVGSRQLARLLDLADHAHAKVVLIGDHHQLPEIDAGGAFRGLLARLDAIELTVNHRQRHQWERHALDALRSGDPAEAIDAFDRAGRITVCGSAADTADQVVADWWDHAGGHPDPTAHGVMLSVRRADVEALNTRARQRMRQAGRLGTQTVPGADRRDFAVGDAAVCSENSPALRVVNGLRGLVTAVDPDTGGLTLRLTDGHERRLPASYLREGKLAHGYALTGHRAQGLTKQRVWVLGSELLYREWAYTALSRHTDSVQLYLTADDTPPDWIEHPAALAPDPRTPHQKLAHAVTLSRAQIMALDQAAADVPQLDPEGRGTRLRSLLEEAVAGQSVAESADHPTVDALDDLTSRVLAIADDPPAHLLAALGPSPGGDQPRRRGAWLSGAAAVERYRSRWDIHDQREALGLLPSDPAQRRDHDQASATLQDAQQHLALTEQNIGPDLGIAI